MPSLVLHQWEMSPFCNKARKCLAYKGLAFETKEYNGLLARQAAKLSGQGTLPVLEANGEFIVDSPAIAAYLDKLQPEPPLYPRDPEALAMARFWEDWAGQSLYFYELHYRFLEPEAFDKALDLISRGRPAFERALLSVVMRGQFPKKLKAQGLGRVPREEIERRLLVHLGDLEAVLSRRTWLVGNAPSIADFSVAAQLDEFVRTSRLAERVLSFPAIKDWLARTANPTRATRPALVVEPRIAD
ncbi:MAG TPA: glutathione S-transferase family protein [Polyangiaceae bacterium]|jgi:glutathione S-transferase